MVMEFLCTWWSRPAVERRRQGPVDDPTGMPVAVAVAAEDGPAVPADILDRFLQVRSAQIVVLDQHRHGQG